MKYKCIIFDCDGVLVDSEGISAKVFQEMAMELGFELDFETAVERFAGASMKDNINFLSQNTKVEIPKNFEKEFRRRTYKAFRTDLQAVPGIQAFLKEIEVPYCVASSGPPEKIHLNLTLTGLIDKFEGKIFSSYDIGSWKPDPGIYLYTADYMGFKPEECLVIEDSLSGIRAAVSGGFDVIALGNEKKKATFEEQGALVFFNYADISEYLQSGH